MLKALVLTRSVFRNVLYSDYSVAFNSSIMTEHMNDHDRLNHYITYLNEAREHVRSLEVQVELIRRRLFETPANGQLPKMEKRTAEPDVEPPKRFKSDFNVENDYVVVYTDGACENNGKSNAKAGIGVWFGENHQLNISKPVNGRATNNTAEIQACIEALEVLKSNNVNKVLIKTDSEFTINCMTKWIEGWKKKNWKLASGGPVKNKIDLEKLDNLRTEFEDVKFEHIKAHVGILGNEMADQLAREGATQYKK